MAALLIIIGLLFGFFGACNLADIASARSAHSANGALIFAVTFGIIGLTMLIFGIKRAGRSREQLGNRRTCPHCAEQIKPDAKVCRYCQRDVPELETAYPV